MTRPPKQTLPILAALAGTIAVGAWLRAPASPAPYLWNDEAWRAQLIAAPGSLFDTLARAQVEGFWFLLTDWLFGRLGLLLFESPEWAFRFWPFVFGVAGLLAIYEFVRRIAGPGAGLCAAALVAVGPGFIYHAREFKPYALDLFASALCLAVATRNGKRAGAPGFGLITALHAFALSSLCFVFVYPAIVLYRFFARGDRSPGAVLALASPAVTFALYFFLFLGPQGSETSAPQLFWNQFYPTSWENLKFLAGEFRHGANLFFLFGWGVLLVATLFGVPFVARRKRDGAIWLLWVPFAMNALFAAFEQYPLFGRSGYFLYAILIAGFSYACAGILGAIPRERRAQVWIPALVLGVGLALATDRRDPYAIGARLERPLPEALERARHWPPDMGREAFALARKNLAPGDRLLLSPNAYYTFLAYRNRDFAAHPELTQPPPGRTRQQMMVRDETTLRLCESAVSKRRGGPENVRYWIVTSMRYDPSIYQDALGQAGGLEWALRAPYQGLARWTPAPDFTCPTSPSIEAFQFSSLTDWAVHAIPIQGFPRFFQLRLHLDTDPGAELEWTLALRNADGSLVASRDLGPRTPRGEPRWINVTPRDFPEAPASAFQHAQALEFRMRSRNGRRSELRVHEARVH